MLLLCMQIRTSHMGSWSQNDSHSVSAVVKVSKLHTHQSRCLFHISAMHQRRTEPKHDICITVDWGRSCCNFPFMSCWISNLAWSPCLQQILWLWFRNCVSNASLALLDASCVNPALFFRSDCALASLRRKVDAEKLYCVLLTALMW